MVHLIMCYWPLQQILLCATGHCGEFSYALWATGADLVVRQVPLRWNEAAQ